MVSRRTVALLVTLFLLSGVSLVGGEVVDMPPKFTVTNEDDTTYRVTAYTIASRQRAMVMNFAVTTEDGERRLVTLSQLYWPEGFQNVTLADDGIPTNRVTVEPGTNESMTVDGWTPGNTTVYLVEDVDDDETHVHTKVESCPVREQEHSMTLRDGGRSGYALCASSVDWLFA